MQRRHIFLPGGELFQIIAGSEQPRRHIMLLRLRSQQHFQQRGFSGSVRPENRDELTGRHLQIEVIPQHPVAEGEPGTGERDNLVNHEY